MSAPVDENADDGTGVTWRLRRFEDEEVAAFAGPIVFELNNIDDLVLATVSIPSETLDVLLRPHLSVFAELQLDGSISLESEFFALFPPSKTTDIYELVKEGITPEMLEDELDVKERLCTLKQRLTEALTLVEHTLANLDKPSG